MSEEHGSSPQDLRRDARDLKRGAAVNLLGYLIRLGLPLLTVWVVRLYGPERFGWFAIAQAALMLVLRVSLLGLDKTVLWWVPRLQPKDGARGIPAMFACAMATAAISTLIVIVLAEPLLHAWSDDSGGPTVLRIMALALLPMVVLELSVHAVMGTRQMAARVVVREGLVPILQVGGAIVLHLLGLESIGLALSFVLAMSIGAVIAAWLAARTLHAIGWPADAWSLPQEIRRYALPIWLSELANTFLTRMDVYALARFTDPRTVGIYAALTQITNTVRSVRQSFDPIVLAVFSQIGHRQDHGRLRAAFSRATVSVLSIQAPLVAFLLLFGTELLPIFGPGFEVGLHAMWILSVAWALNGVLGLHGLVLLGYGRSDLVLLGTLVTIALQGVLLATVGATFGLDGVAIAVGGSYVLLNLAQWALAQRISGVNPYDAEVLRALVWLGAAIAGLLLTRLALAGLQSRISAAIALIAFVAIGAAGIWGDPRRTRHAPTRVETLPTAPPVDPSNNG